MSITSRIDMDFAVLEMCIREKDIEIERLRSALEGLLQFNEELCADIGVSKHYPSAEKARAALEVSVGNDLEQKP